MPDSIGGRTAVYGGCSIPGSDDEIMYRYHIAASRVSLDLLRLRMMDIKAGFREDQSRDDRGRWNGGGGTVIVTRKDKTDDPKLDRMTDELVDITKELIERIGRGQSFAYGVGFHIAMAGRLRELDLPGIGVHGVEQNFSLGDTARYGLNGTVRTDVVLRDGRTSSAPIRAIWDFKTGNARLEPLRVVQLRRELGVDETVPVIETHIDKGVGVKAYRLRHSSVYSL